MVKNVGRSKIESLVGEGSRVNALEPQQLSMAGKSPTSVLVKLGGEQKSSQGVEGTGKSFVARGQSEEFS